MKSVKQLSDEIGVSKTQIMKTINRLGLRTELKTEGNKFLIDEVQEGLILKALKEKTQTENENKSENRNDLQTQLVFDTIAILQKQLEQKDKQIEELHRLLEVEKMANSQKLLEIEQKTQTSKWWQFWK